MSAKTKLLALNLGLAAALALIIWQGRDAWREAQAMRRATVNVPVKRVTPPPVTPAKKPEAVQAAQYADVAAKNLFSKDRNPTVTVDAGKVEPPKVMPQLPVVYGVLGLPSGVKAIMAEHAGTPNKTVATGDSVGEFKILALDLRKVTFEWEGRQIERNLDDLADHTGAPAQAAGPAMPAPAQNATPAAAAMGGDNGSAEAPTRTCKNGDSSPIGAVIDGYKKTGTQTPFGIMNCNWVKQ